MLRVEQGPSLRSRPLGAIQADGPADRLGAIVRSLVDRFAPTIQHAVVPQSDGPSGTRLVGAACVFSGKMSSPRGKKPTDTVSVGSTGNVEIADVIRLAFIPT